MQMRSKKIPEVSLNSS